MTEGKSQRSYLDQTISMEALHTDRMRAYTDVVDLLRPLKQDLELPAIALLGDHNSGKSSVLEALCGVALPRGQNNTLYLRMNRTKGNEWYAIFKHRKQSSSSFEEKIIHHRKDVAETVRNEIPRGTVHSGMFILEIFSPDVPDLTLIALPSIPPDNRYNEQNRNQIKKHIKELIKNPECIILMVVPCNVDITTTEALKMAQEVDPDGERTLGLLTKPDLVDQVKEKDIVDIVQNKVIKLKKGFMIVRYYDQTKTSVMDPIEKEKNFFKDHALFKSFYDDGFATFPKLAERLCKELLQHIEKKLPHLKEYVKKELLEANAALKRLGDAPPSDKDDKLTFLTNKLTTFTQDVMRLTTGDLLDLTDQSVFGVWRKIVKDSDESFQCKLGSEFNNFETLENLIKHQIKLLEEPAVFTLSSITEIVRNELLNLMENHFLGFQRLISKAKATISDVTSKKQKAAELWLRTYLRMEQFEVQAEASKCKQKREKKRGTATQLYSYYQTVCQRLACQIPMMIRFYMFKELSTELQKELFQLLNEKEVLNLLYYNLGVLRQETERSFIPLTKAQIMLLEL